MARLSLDRLAAVDGFVARCEETLAMVLLATIAAVVNLEVVARYVIDAPLIWPEEVTRLLLVWLSFIASAAVTRRGEHIAVDTVLTRLPSRLRALAHHANDLLMAMLFLWLAVIAAELAIGMSGMTMAATEWPAALLVWPLTVGGVLIAAHSILRVVARRGGSAEASPSPLQVPV